MYILNSLLLPMVLIGLSAPACFSTFYRSTVVPTLIENFFNTLFVCKATRNTYYTVVPARRAGTNVMDT